jgi:hypothetical protein
MCLDVVRIFLKWRNGRIVKIGKRSYQQTTNGGDVQIVSFYGLLILRDVPLIDNQQTNIGVIGWLNCSISLKVTNWKTDRFNLCQICVIN